MVKTSGVCQIIKNLFEKELLVDGDHCLVGFDTMYFDRLVLTFQLNLLPPSSR
jgi:hypothetical protein